MSPETKKRLAYAAGGILLGAAAYFLYDKAVNQQDEDRPPIVVKGGSLNFYNGAPSRPGKAWKSSALGFQLDHDRGKPVSSFQLYFVGGTGACSPVTTSDFTVSFDHDGIADTPARLYTVNVRSDKGRPAPTASGPDLVIDTGDSRRLYTGTAGTGSLVSVAWSSLECAAPTEVWVESIR